MKISNACFSRIDKQCTLMKKTFPSSAGDQEETEDGKENSQTTVVAISISRCL